MGMGLVVVRRSGRVVRVEVRGVLGIGARLTTFRSMVEDFEKAEVRHIQEWIIPQASSSSISSTPPLSLHSGIAFSIQIRPHFNVNKTLHNYH